MTWLIIILLYFTAGVIIYQDLNSRAVIWIAFPLLLLIGAFYSLYQDQSLAGLLTNTAINAGFLSIQFLLLWLFFFIKNRSKSVAGKIGLGDIFFLLSCCSFFSPLNFLIFYISSLLFTLIVFLIFKSVVTEKAKLTTVPLAGLQSLFLLVFLSINMLGQNNLTTDSWFLKKITGL